MTPLLLFALSILPAECPSKTELDVRNGHALSFHGGLARTVLFGGADECAVRGDTWAWDGHGWERLSEEGPGGRTFPGMAYDARRDELVLFGGNAVLFGVEPDPATFLDDTWIFRDGSWRRPAASGPSARAEPAMAYDERRERLVLFGGYRLEENGESRRLGDTWEWDGSSWQEVSRSGPSPRNGASLAFSPRHEGVVLFGGNGPSSESWLWNGTVWTRLPLLEPPGRFNPALARDPLSGGLLRFGGWDGERRVGDTWRLLDEWSRLALSGPSPRNHAPAAFDGRRGRVILFGGHDGELVFGDTWEWDGVEWKLARPGIHKRRVENGH